jgi:hypothetical protein
MRARNSISTPSIGVLEVAAALLQEAGADERRLLIARAAALAEQTPQPDKKEFLASIGENLGIAT